MENRRLYTRYGCLSTLPLLVPRIGTNHADHALTADDLAVAADALDGCENFHGFLRFQFIAALTWRGTRCDPWSGHKESIAPSPCRRAVSGCNACAFFRRCGPERNGRFLA